MRIAIFLAATACVQAQSSLDRPVLGQMLDRQQFLRPVYGAGGSFHVDAPVAEGVIASACSQTLCLAKTNAGLISNGSITPAPPGPAIIGLDSTGANIYFPSIQQFGRWQNGTLTFLDLSVSGTVLSLGSNSSGLTIAVERSGTIWVVSANGAILDSLPPTAAAVLLTAAGTVYATPDALILRKTNGSELDFPAPGITGLIALGADPVEAQAGATLYALRTIAGQERLLQLPQPQPEWPRRPEALKK